MADTAHVTVTEPALVTPAPPAARPVARPMRWEPRYRRTLVTLDAVCGGTGGLLAVLFRYGWHGARIGVVDYRVIGLSGALLWPLVLLLTSAYDGRVLGLGTEEYRRVASGAVRLLAGIALITFTGKVSLGRSFVALAVPLTVGFTLVARWSARQVLHRRRRRGKARSRVLVVGTPGEVRALQQAFARAAHAGYDVTAACVAGPRVDVGAPVMGPPAQAAEVAVALGVDAVAVTAGAALGDNGLRRLGWSLEGTGIDLLVAPALTDVTGPRLTVRPVDGIPLLHVDEPVLDGPRRLIKATMDRVVATLALVVLVPVFIVVGILIRATSSGPVFYRQVRVGRDGERFRLWKFRTMVDRADTFIPAQNDGDGLLFKLRRDPRVTPIGRVLRRWSIDELPQLINVVRGDMSLVGPRPPLPSEVERYGDDVARRLLVKPGLTGLWQVSGRSDLSWEDSVRLDLRYVENWSVSMDFAILARTVVAVLNRRGAY